LLALDDDLDRLSLSLSFSLFLFFGSLIAHTQQQSKVNRKIEEIEEGTAKPEEGTRNLEWIVFWGRN